jgi:hypothetical protein
MNEGDEQAADCPQWDAAALPPAKIVHGLVLFGISLLTARLA